MLKTAIDRLHVEGDAKLTAYIEEKIGKLDKYLPRQARSSAHADVKLKRGPGRGKKQFICEVVVHLPKETVTTNQAATSLEAAVDLAEAKLKNQLHRYKEKHATSRRRRVLRGFRFR